MRRRPLNQVKSNLHYDHQQNQQYLKLEIDSAKFNEPLNFVLTVLLKSYGTKLTTDISDEVAQPSFHPDTFYIPVPQTSFLPEDVLLFEVLVVKNEMHTSLGTAQVSAAQLNFNRYQSISKYLILYSSNYETSGLKVGSFKLTISFTEKAEELIQECQTEQNHLNSIFTRSMIEGTENPTIQSSKLTKLLVLDENLSNSMVDMNNIGIQQKWKIYSNALKSKHQALQTQQNYLEKYQKILHAQSVIRADLLAGNKLLRQLVHFNTQNQSISQQFVRSIFQGKVVFASVIDIVYNFDKISQSNRVRVEDEMACYSNINIRLRRMGQSEVYQEIRRNMMLLQKEYSRSNELENFLLQALGYISSVGKLMSNLTDWKDNLSEAHRVAELMQSAVFIGDYLKQKVVRQNEILNNLSVQSKTMAAESQQIQQLQSEMIDVRGDVLASQQKIVKSVYGNNPEQHSQLQELKVQCSKLLKTAQQQQIEILYKQAAASSLRQPINQLACLQSTLQAACKKVEALEEQIKLNSEEFAKQMASLQFQIQIKKNKISTLSMSSISYILPNEINPIT